MIQCNVGQLQLLSVNELQQLKDSSNCMHTHNAVGLLQRNTHARTYGHTQTHTEYCSFYTGKKSRMKKYGLIEMQGKDK